MSDTNILSQSMNEDDLEEIAGGRINSTPRRHLDDDIYNCTRMSKRDITEKSPANCAATVEDGSWCYGSDACLYTSVVYTGMKNCSKAWK